MGSFFPFWDESFPVRPTLSSSSFLIACFSSWVLQLLQSVSHPPSILMESMCGQSWEQVEAESYNRRCSHRPCSHLYTEAFTGKETPADWGVGLQISEVQICQEERKPPGKGLLINNCMREGMCRMLKFHLSKYCFHGVSDLTLCSDYP